MNYMNKKTFLWTPRVLAIIFTAFLSIFALDVFGEGYSFLETLVALFMHLVPTFILIILLVIAWKKELVGGILFLCVGAAFIFWFKTYEDIINFLLISFPILLVGALLVLSHYVKIKKHH